MVHAPACVREGATGTRVACTVAPSYVFPVQLCEAAAWAAAAPTANWHWPVVHVLTAPRARPPGMRAWPRSCDTPARAAAALAIAVLLCAGLPGACPQDAPQQAPRPPGGAGGSCGGGACARAGAGAVAPAPGGGPARPGADALAGAGASASALAAEGAPGTACLVVRSHSVQAPQVASRLLGKQQAWFRHF